MILKFEKIPLKERFFMISWSIYLIIKILGTSFYLKYFPDHINFYLVIICIFPLMLHEMINMKRSYRELVGIVICIFLVILTMRLKFMGGGGTDVALMFTFIYCGRKISYSRVAKLTIFVTGSCLCFIILSGFLGVIPNYIAYGARIRQYVGFRYALFGPAYMFNITLLFLYIKQQKISWKAILILTVCNWCLYVWTNSRLSFGLTELALIYALIAKSKWNWLNKKHWWYWLVVLSFALCAVTSLIGTVVYSENNKILSLTNSFLGGRLADRKSVV